MWYVTNDHAAKSLYILVIHYSLLFTLYDVIEEDKYNQDQLIRRELILSEYACVAFHQTQ